MKPETIQRFLSRVEKTESCWIWKSTYLPNGYGQIRVEGRTYLTHRLSWIIHKGEIPKGLQILHKCDNPSCVNPDHLELGNQSKNIKDSLIRKRHGIYTHPEKFQIYGEDTTSAKFTNKQAQQIRDLWNSGRFTQTELGKIYQVNSSQISRLVRGETYKCQKV